VQSTHVLRDPIPNPKCQVAQPHLSPAPVSVGQDEKDAEGQRILPGSARLGDVDGLSLTEALRPWGAVLDQRKEDQQPLGSTSAEVLPMSGGPTVQPRCLAQGLQQKVKELLNVPLR
jgi:hypothetical protein